MNWDTFFTQASIGLVIGGIAAYLTMRFALSRFYREKWWEKRAAAYISLTESLYTLKNDYIAFRDDSFQSSYLGDDMEPLLTEEEIKEINARRNSTISQITKLSELGPLVLTTSASEKLRDFLKEERKVHREVMEDGLDHFEAYDKMSFAAEQLFFGMMEEAKHELRVASLGEKIKTNIRELWRKAEHLYKENLPRV